MSTLLRLLLIILLPTLLGLTLSGNARADTPTSTQVALNSTPAVAPAELENAIGSRIQRVEEFRFIQEEAAKLGVRAWLFGGTAAGFAHYVKWDVQREKGDPRFQPDRFDYDYTNIYRSTQDLDIVIDGNEQQVQALQKALQEKYPHLQGSKTAWEVRSLTQKIGPKEALLNNPDFLNQHTDSNSTGMIELTGGPGTQRVRDLRDWKSKSPNFLKDVAESKLHYYFSPTHATTNRAAQGLNPPIFSAIRYLTKAFQYESEMRPEDLARIQKVVQEFNPERDLKIPETQNWIEKNGKKLLQHAVNLEYAWNTLERLGLREKLAGIKNNPNDLDSLSWWMNKEPLREKPIGQGTGRTAKEIFDSLGLKDLVVSHETTSFQAYESITRAHTGSPNVLISREGISGEAALSGSGFYTKAGREGARYTGLTIRFRLDPNAREGEDFIYVPEHQFFVIRNKAAIRVIPESLRLTPVGFFEYLRSNAIEHSDKGILEKLKRRAESKMGALTAQEKEQIIRMGLEEARNESPSTAFMSEWFNLPLTKDFRERAIDRYLAADHQPFRAILRAVHDLPSTSEGAGEIKAEARDLVLRPLLGPRPGRSWYVQMSGVVDYIDTHLSELPKASRSRTAEQLANFMDELLDQDDLAKEVSVEYFRRHPRNESERVARLWDHFDARLEKKSISSADLFEKWLTMPSSSEGPNAERALEIAMDYHRFNQRIPLSFLQSEKWARTGYYRQKMMPLLENSPRSHAAIAFLGSDAAQVYPEVVPSIEQSLLDWLKDPETGAVNISDLAYSSPDHWSRKLKNALHKRLRNDPEFSKALFRAIADTYANPTESPWVESNEMKKILGWISETQGKSLDPSGLIPLLGSAKVRARTPNLDGVLLNAFSPENPLDNTPSWTYRVIESDELARSPRRMDVLKAFVDHPWKRNVFFAHEWILKGFTALAQRPEYRGEKEMNELMPLILRVLDRSMQEYAIPSSAWLSGLLKDEPYRHYQNAKLWRQALESSQSKRYEHYLELANSVQTRCSAEFESLRATHGQ